MQAQQYATIAQLQNFMSVQALSAPSISSPTVQNAALYAASETVDGYLRQQFQLPLTQWGNDIVRTTCWLAAYQLVCTRGFSPTSDVDASYLENFKMASRWLKDVSEGKISPDITDSSPNAGPGVQTPPAQPLAYSPNTTRGTCKR